jgi:hypothetical protein
MKRFGLKEFGAEARSEKVDTTTILAILVAFNIPLFTEAFRKFTDLDVFASYFFGALTLIFFMLYLVDYYEKIWVRWFSLPDDFVFFRVYSLVLGVITIAIMNVFPEYWYWYLSILFLVMSLKKYSTRRQYMAAFDAAHGSFSQCKNKSDKAVCLLARNMSKNFFVYGFVYSIPVAALISAANHWGGQNIAFTVGKLPFHGNGYYIAASALWSLILCGFWLHKIRSELNYFVTAVEKGDFEFFDKVNK